MTSLLATLAYANAASVEQARQKAARHAAAVGKRTATIRRISAQAAAAKRRKHRRLVAQLLRREQPTTMRVADWLGLSEQAARNVMLGMEADGLAVREKEGRAVIWKAA